MKTNKIPKGFVALERFFDDRDVRDKDKATIKTDEEVERINLGTDCSPKDVFIGKNLTPKIRQDIISLLRTYRHIFSWSYDNLKAYREDFFQHEVPLKPDAKPFSQRQRPINPTLAPKMKEELIKMRDV